jgi:formate dehydrogenase iron-sulfur subunit
MNIYSDAIVLKSSTTTATPQARSTVAEVGQLIDVTKCIGCKACTAACFVWNELRDEISDAVGIYDEEVVDLSDQMWSVMRFNEIDTPDGRVEWLMRKDSCMHCEEPGCLKACPAPGAIVKYANGVVDFNQANCIGCGYCVAGCPFNIPRISKKDNKAYKCTMCQDRLEVGLAPVCVKTCPSGAITFGIHKDMMAMGEKRVEQLKERGFQNAALYNPQGVGGTHVMYVLKHGDQPELYNGLPKDPKVSPWVGLWRGAAKPIMSLGLGVAALGLFFHYLTRGPQEEDAAEETHGGNETRGGEKS